MEWHGGESRYGVQRGGDIEITALDLAATGADALETS